MLEAGSVILGSSAVVAEKPMPNMAVHSAAKAAMAALFSAVRTEARRRKIRVVDVRPPHTETGLADRAIAGEPPKLPTGLDPDAVAARIVEALLGKETDVANDAFQLADPHSAALPRADTESHFRWVFFAIPCLLAQVT